MKDFFKLIRINDLLFLVILLGLMQKYVVEPLLQYSHLSAQMPWYLLLLMIVGVVAIAAGGYVVNDYFDVKIDAINRPDDMLVTRSFSRQQAMLIFQVATGLGVVCGLALAVLLGSMPLACVYVLIPGLLWFYSSSYKRQFLVGNLIIALSTALLPLVVAIANQAYLGQQYGEVIRYSQFTLPIYQWLGGYALLLFLMTWMCEIVKDMQDVQGDRELECHTVPVVLGSTGAKVFVTVLTVLLLAFLTVLTTYWIPGGFQWTNFFTRMYLFMCIALFCFLWLLWSARVPNDFRSTHTLLKFILFIAVMSAFAVPKVL